jgi:hypothetical protein
MEGFVPEKWMKLLGLEKLGYTASLLAPLVIDMMKMLLSTTKS